MQGITGENKPMPARGRFIHTNRYQLKIALSYIAVIVVMLVLLNTYPIYIAQQFVFQSKRSDITARANLVSSSLASSLTNLETLPPEGVSRIMAMLEDRSFTRVVITDADGLVIYDNAPSDPVTGRYALISEIYLALQRKDVFYSKYANGAFESCGAVPILSQSRLVGAVYIYEYDSAQAALLLGLQQTIATISIIISTIVVFVSLLVSFALSRRIGELLRAIRLVRGGAYEHRAPVRGRDELADLSMEFNELTGRLQTTEARRRQFVSDASHELKTPLASIRLLSDSILQTPDIPMQTIREFVADIGDESDRLARMTEKLLALTRLDSVLPAQAKRIDLKPLTERVGRRLSPLASDADVTLQLELGDGCLILGDEDDLFGVVFNLMENAIKYNHPGGTVRVILFTREPSVFLLVDDTGIGIPADDIPLLFNRFYRVDKARSREQGGAGLGLSIVQTTIQQFDGAISVESRVGEGTRFTVVFPKADQEAPE